MGKSWKKDGMMANAQKKGVLFTKMAKEIAVSARLGGPDPEANSRLRMAIDAARKVSCPKDTIERAIKKGSGQLSTDQIEEITYEGYGPFGVGVIVECQSDNRNRTAPDLRSIFKKHGGAMGENGSVAWMFDRISLIEGTPASTDIDPEEEAIEAGADAVEAANTEGQYSFTGAADELDIIRKNLIARGWSINVSELSYNVNNFTEINEEQHAVILKFVDALDDHEDSYRIYVTLK